MNNRYNDLMLKKNISKANPSTAIQPKSAVQPLLGVGKGKRKHQSGTARTTKADIRMALGPALGEEAEKY